MVDPSASFVLFALGFSTEPLSDSTSKGKDAATSPFFVKQGDLRDAFLGGKRLHKKSLMTSADSDKPSSL